MATSSVQLWERIHDAELASPDECRSWATEIAKSSSPDVLHDPERLAAELIRLGKITSFQANVLFTNQAISLVCGSYRIIQPLVSTLGPNWFQAVDVAKPNSLPLVCYQLTEQNLSQSHLRAWPPSLELAERSVALSHPSLDRWFFAGLHRTSLLAVCELYDCKSLSDVLANHLLDWRASVAMVEQVASGIQKMHEAGLVHGNICADAILGVDESEFVLRRDPFFPPANPYSANAVSIVALNRETLIGYGAPEFTLPNAIPSVQTDLYALGCVWYQALAGNYPFGPDPIKSTQEWANAHLTKSIQPLPSSVLPPPLHRCLSHLLAKNPSSRFATATELIKAIEFAVNESEKWIEAQAAKKVSELAKPVAIAKPEPAAKQKPVAKIDPISKPVPALTPESTPGRAPGPPVVTQPMQAIASVSSPPTQSVEHLTPSLTAEVKPTVSAPFAKTSSQGDQPASELPTPLANPSAKQVNAPELEAKAIASPSPGKSLTGPVRSSSGKNKRKLKKKKKPMWVLPAMIGGACLLFGIVITLLVRNGTKTIAVDPNPSNAPSTRTTTTSPTTTSVTDKPESRSPATGGNSVGSQQGKPTDLASEFFTIDKDDGQSLWAPPYAGSAYSLELFPAGVEAVLFASSDMWYGRGAAGPLNQWWSESQPELTKLFSSIPLLGDPRIQTVAIGLYPSKNPGLPQAVFRVSFAQPTSIDSIVKGLSDYKWKAFDSKTSVKKGFWSNELQANATSIVMEEMQSDGAALVKRIVIGPSELLGTIPDLNGGPAPLRRQLETLLKTTDSRSDLTILAAPSFLFGDGRELLSGFPKLQEALREAMDESMQAVLFVTSLEPRWYMELRLISSETRDITKFASAIKSSLVVLPDEFEKGLSSGVALHPYWRALGLRYPQMMRAMNRYLRVGLEDGQVVANVYLPTEAIGNIAIASWMAVNQSAGISGSNVGAKPAPTTKPPSKSIEEVLASAITIGFEQESLEAALQLIAGEVAESVVPGSAISMTIDGTSFQKEGITRNQSIRAFKQNSVPLRIVLTDLVRRANPVTTVVSTSERNQKVVWVVLEDPDHPGANKIELTTRTNAESKKFTLPKEFVAQ